MRSSATASDPDAGDLAGPAHVATVSFLASRAAPTGGFWVALAGGTALARVAQRRGAREGYGASVAATLETVAIIGPARFSVPFTQAVSAPLLGRLEARGRRALVQVVACTAIRVATNAMGAAFFIWVIAGGLDAYAGSYDALADRFGFSLGETGTLLFTLAGLLVWGVFASVVQVAVYRRGLARWPDEGSAHEPSPERAAPLHRGRFDPRAVALSATLAFALLLTGTGWLLLGACALALALAWGLSRPDSSAVPTGLVLAALLAVGAFTFTLGGGLGLDEALRRASRATLVVLVATWLRAAAGADGLREVFRRGLERLRRLPAVSEAARTLDSIGSEGRLLAAGRALIDALSAVPMRPAPVLDAVLGWVSGEASRFRSAAPSARLELRARATDAALVALAAAPGAAHLA